MTAGRIVLLLTSPRTGPGLLTWPAWEQLRAADEVLAADPDPDWARALAEAGCDRAGRRGRAGRRAGRPAG